MNERKITINIDRATGGAPIRVPFVLLAVWPVEGEAFYAITEEQSGEIFEKHTLPKGVTSPENLRQCFLLAQISEGGVYSFTTIGISQHQELFALTMMKYLGLIKPIGKKEKGKKKKVERA